MDYTRCGEQLKRHGAPEEGDAIPVIGVSRGRLGVRRLIPLLSSPLGLDTLRRLRPLAIPQQFHRGQIVFHEDLWPLGIHIHASGPVRFVRRGKAVAPPCYAPCLMGLQILFAGARYPCSALAQGNVWVGFISRSRLEKILERHPALLSILEGAPKKTKSVPGDAFIS